MNQVPRCLTRVCARLQELISAHPEVFGDTALIYRSGSTIIYRKSRDVKPSVVSENAARAWLAAMLAGRITQDP